MVVPLSVDFIKAIHKAVLDDDPKAARGYRHEGMIEVCMERATNVVYGHEQFKSNLDKAAALMFSINVFEPFNDGCKRTSLLATYFFLLVNGYQFVITKGIVALTFKIAMGEIKDEHAVADWIRKHSTKNKIPRLFNNIRGDEPFLAPIIVSLLDLTRKFWVK